MTAIRSILLHLDASPGSAARLTLALALADRFDARVTALFGVQSDAAQPAFAYSAAAALRAAEESEALHDMELARLHDACTQDASRCAWYSMVGDAMVHGFATEAAYADLLILGQPAASMAGGGPPTGFAEAVILRCGTPAVVVPYPHRQEALGRCVLVAWDGSPPAARAVKAALPLLQSAAQVHVATWAPQAPFAPFSGMDLKEWLRRHGVSSQVHRRGPSARVAEEISSLAHDLYADLVVMGCYGHGRLREQLFGGATRGALALLSVPVLMAH